MAKNFITNNADQKSLKDRIQTLISISEELKAFFISKLGFVSFVYFVLRKIEH